MDEMFQNFPGQTWPPEFLKHHRWTEEEHPTEKWVKSHRKQQARISSIEVHVLRISSLQGLEGVQRDRQPSADPIWDRIPGLPESIHSGVLSSDVVYWVRREAWNSEAGQRMSVSKLQESEYPKVPVNRRFGRSWRSGEGEDLQGNQVPKAVTYLHMLL